MPLRFCLLTPVVCAALNGAPATFEPSQIVDSYVAVSRMQHNKLQGASMEVDIEAELPKLRKKGRLHALRRISALGRLTYVALGFEGDRSIKNDVITRYLSADAEAWNTEDASLAVTPANYKFHYKGLVKRSGQTVHLFGVAPRKKRVGLFVGELWLDPDTYLPLRESGRFVKNPSIFLRRVEFVKEYDIREGVAIPRRIESCVDTRLVGRAKLTIDFSSVSLAEAGSPALAGESQ